jgi:TonB-dependent SusC/RagA subfamily outer membrane receptor
LKGPGDPNKHGSITIRNQRDPLGLQNPLIIIDGKESPIQIVKDLKIDPETIESVSILKGETATKTYGVKAQYGVIIITTKKTGPAVKDTTKYRDRITSVNGDVKEWELIKDIKGKKLFMVDKKFLTNNEKEFERWLSKNEIHLIEFNSNQSDLKKYELDRNGGIVNAITLSNKNNKDAYLNPPKTLSPEMMDRIYAEARERNCVFIGIKNPIVVKVEGTDTKDLVVKMDDLDQGVSYEKGTFNVVPRNGTQGTNIKIDIYRKDSNGNLKLLNTRYFRAENLPDPRNFLTT